MSVSGRSGDEDKPDREDQYRTSGKPGFVVRCDMVRRKKAQVPRGCLQVYRKSHAEPVAKPQRARLTKRTQRALAGPRKELGCEPH